VKRKSLGFTEGMLVGMAKPEGARKCMDWDKALSLIQENRPDTAYAGLMEDWDCTSQKIWEKGKKVTEHDIGYFTSHWATPMLVLEDKGIQTEFECWKLGSENGLWSLTECDT
jgi:hypothetical protein